MTVTDEYWKGVRSSHEFLKEYFRRVDREKVKESIGKRIPRDTFDSLFLNEVIQFLRLAIINLLSYKYLAKGHYLAWAEVTLYYSYFYVINCLLRLQKYAIVHINYIDDDHLIIVIDRCKDNRYYNIRNCRGNQHDLIWKTFERYYPDLISEGIGKLFREDRTKWNYDLFYASQTTTEHALREARIRWETNFLDPNYGMYEDPDAVAYYSDLMADTGYEEAGVGELIKHAIEKFSKIGLKGVFNQIQEDLDKIESSEETKRVILTWMENA